MVLAVMSLLAGAVLADSYYALSYAQRRGLAFDATGALVLLDAQSLLYVPREAEYHVLSLPRLPADEEPRLLAFRGGVWLRAGRTVAYASLDRAWPSSSSNPVELSWQTFTLDAQSSRPGSARAATDADGSLLLEQAGEALLRLSPSHRGLVATQLQGPLPPTPTLGEPYACADHGTHAVLSYRDAQGAARTVILPEVRGDKFRLCAARVVHEQGRVWFATEDHVFSEYAESLLIIGRELPPPVLVRLKRLLPDAEQLVAPLIVLAAFLSLWFGVWLTGARPVYRPIARSVGAALFAPPFLFLTALTIDTIGIHASPAPIVGPLAATCALLPSFGAWLGDWLSDRHREQVGKRSTLQAILGTLAGGLLGVPLVLYLFNSRAESSTTIVGVVISSLVVGFATALGYLRVRGGRQTRDDDAAEEPA